MDHFVRLSFFMLSIRTVVPFVPDSRSNRASPIMKPSCVLGNSTENRIGILGSEQPDVTREALRDPFRETSIAGE